MTVRKCLQLCKEKNKRFGGLRQKDQCHCGDTIDDVTRRVDFTCNFPCSGNENEICGGHNRNVELTRISIYEGKLICIGPILERDELDLGAIYRNQLEACEGAIDRGEDIHC